MAHAAAVQPPTRAVECERCTKNARYGIEPACRACYWPFAKLAPNVQLAESQAQELRTRYDKLHAVAVKRGTKYSFELAAAVGAQSVPVTTVSIPYTLEFFQREKNLYAPYARQVQAGIRAPADELDDMRRRIVDISMYASYGAEMTFAALSGNGFGVTAWGEIHFELDQRAVGYRATVLEENSFSFVSKRRLAEAIVQGQTPSLAGSLV